jgi:ribosomal protein S6
MGYAFRSNLDRHGGPPLGPRQGVSDLCSEGRRQKNFQEAAQLLKETGASRRTSEETLEIRKIAYKMRGEAHALYCRT